MSAKAAQKSIQYDLIRFGVVMVTAATVIGYTLGIVSRPRDLPTSIQNGVRYHRGLK